jgi:hypothetical protein
LIGEGYNLGQRIITVSLQGCPMSNFSKLTVENEPNQKSNNQSMIKSDKQKKKKKKKKEGTKFEKKINKINYMPENSGTNLTCSCVKKYTLVILK